MIDRRGPSLSLGIRAVAVLGVLFACTSEPTDPLIVHPDIFFYGAARTTAGATQDGLVVAEERAARVNDPPCSMVLTSTEVRVTDGHYSLLLSNRTTMNGCTILRFLPQDNSLGTDSVLFPYPTYLERADSVVNGVVYLRHDWDLDPNPTPK